MNGRSDAAASTAVRRRPLPPSASPVILGVRHHGPGSARAVRRALEAYRPEVVLIEGPPEGDRVVALAADPQMRPPVALLAYAADTKPTGAKPSGAKPTGAKPTDGKPPDTGSGAGGGHRVRRAAYWPFAEFSPEWQAIRWALAHDVPVQFCDLPAGARFDRTSRRRKLDTEPDIETEPGPGAHAETEAGPERADPIALLARAGGYDDPERWWEDTIEHREPTHGDDELAHALAPFEAIAEAMAAVRAAAPAPQDFERIREERREAHMRTVLRAAGTSYRRVAVVCGAWHVPALSAPLPPATADREVLRGLRKTKTAITWVPWTHGRLASWQGYGAGVTSPGWYHHLFTALDRPITRWMVQVATVLREEGLTVSSAHVIEAVRLAETLAVLRGRPLAGLTEVTEATRAVLCDGDDVQLALVNRRLVVGERLGTVPADTPSVPLAGDVAAAQRRLRLPPSPLSETKNLDLRRDIDLDRSRLLHRLRLLGVAWGEPAAEEDARRGLGTFWETWHLRWRPEFAVDLVEASGYGTTVAAAATAKTAELAGSAASLAQVTALVELCLLAELADAFPPVLRALDERVALDVDVAHLMAALPALARTLRYGDVRGTDVSSLTAVTHGLVVRICVGLPAAIAPLDDDAAAEMRGHLDAVHNALGLLGEPSLTDEWLATLHQLAGREDLHGVLAGRLTRLLLDAGRLPADEAGRRMRLVLTVGMPPARGAAWVEGFLAGGGLLLVHDERLLALADAWLADIPPETFVEVLPLLRRTFAEFTDPERRAIGERVRRLDEHGGAAPAPAAMDDLDSDRAAVVLPTLRLLLGREILEPGGREPLARGRERIGSEVPDGREPGGAG